MDRTKFAKENKSDLIEFCKRNNLNTADCFAKIDYVNLIMDNEYTWKQFQDYLKNTNNTVSLKGDRNEPTVVGLKAPNNAMSLKPPAKMSRTATRFCVDANIEKDDEIDMANFILAARYLGTTANDDQLMDIFMNMEQETDGNKSSKEMIKDLMNKVEEEYGSAENADGDAEVFQLQILPDHAADAEWQQNQIDDFLISQQQDQNLAIAKNLLETTALTRHEVAQITGVDADALKDYESDEYDSDESEFETDSEADEDIKEDDDATEDKQPLAEENTFSGVKVVASNKKSVLFTSEEVNALKRIADTGTSDNIKQQSDEVMTLLQKLRDAVNIAPGAMKRAKTLAKLAVSGAPTQDKPAVQKPAVPPVTFPVQYRVVINPGALCKAEKDKTSALVGKVAIGTIVVVEEICGARARISEPHEGWCSLVSSKNGRAILQRADLKTDEMDKAVRKAMGRQTKIVILKSVTTLNEKTVETMLEKCNWNLRIAIDSFFIAKYKTQEYIDKNKEGEGKSQKKGWFKSWKKFANDKK